MIKLNVYKITSGGTDYYYLKEDEAVATGHTVTTVDTHKGSPEALATLVEKPIIALKEEVVEGTVIDDSFEDGPLAKTLGNMTDEDLKLLEEAKAEIEGGECCEHGECDAPDDPDKYKTKAWN
tara:strand:+ start:5967 stop:6335 length:369 start_codon:yes stop_codon:yes gene_type:complete